MKNDVNNLSKSRFCEILAFFSEAEYVQKVNFMKNEWGNIAERTVIKYDDGCSIEVGIENNKYYFQFVCENFTLEELLDSVPFYADDIINLEKNELLNKYKEIIDVNINETENGSATNNVEQDLPLEEAEEVAVESDYLNLYNGIKITKKEN